MTEVLFAGLFTIVGAIVGGLLSKYGLPSISGKHHLVFSGRGKLVSIQESFSKKNEKDVIEIKSGRIVWSNKKSTLKANCIIKTKKYGDKICVMTGEADKGHPYSGATFYIELLVKNESGTYPAKGILSVLVTPPGTLYGELVFEDLFNQYRNGFTFAKIEFYRSAELPELT